MSHVDVNVNRIHQENPHPKNFNKFWEFSKFFQNCENPAKLLIFLSLVFIFFKFCKLFSKIARHQTNFREFAKFCGFLS